MPNAADLDPVSLRREYLVRLDEIEQAYVALQQALASALAAVAPLREHVAAGRRMRDVAVTIPEVFEPRPLRSELSEAMDAVERARHATQRAYFSLLISEGLTMAEIGRMVGVSRSLVSRIVREP